MRVTPRSAVLPRRDGTTGGCHGSSSVRMPGVRSPSYPLVMTNIAMENDGPNRNRWLTWVYLLIAWWIFPWQTVSHNQVVNGITGCQHWTFRGLKIAMVQQTTYDRWMMILPGTAWNQVPSAMTCHWTGEMFLWLWQALGYEVPQAAEHFQPCLLARKKNRPEGKTESGKSSFFKRGRIVVKPIMNHPQYYSTINGLDSNHPQMLGLSLALPHKKVVVRFSLCIWVWVKIA